MDFDSLKRAAADLNAARDTLTAQVQAFEQLIADAQPGVSAWYVYTRNPEDGRDRAIGYSKISGHWRVGLRQTRTTNGRYDPEIWPFNEAPTFMRIESVKFLPDLLATLVERVRRMTIQVRSRAKEVGEINQAIRSVADSVAESTNEG